ncbi:MAG: beta strand repeat-containing protein, partial [Nonlabens sp.]|uniref:beta strand repeat-containing protein n=1 Tax=Nonlabens sp. TaxID=1888209 RepID=UPI003EF315AE
ETLTTLVLNADDTNLDYTDEDGVTTQLDFTDLIANLETITTLVDNTDGTFTYTNEAGTPITIDTNAAETLTTLVLNADDTNLDYTDEDGTTTQLDFTDLVANLETITTLVDNTDGTFTYTNEAGTPITIDTNAAETLTTLVLNADDTNLDYTDEDGVTTQLDFTDLVANLETITTLVDNTDGTFTYTNEAGTPVTIDTNAVETLTTLVLNADDTNLDYTDEDGVTTQLDFTDLVANLETITTLVDNTDGTFTYTNEAGTPITIDTNAAETLTTLVLNADDTNLDYTDEDGTTTQLDFTDLVANLETITTLVDNTDGTFTYTNEAGTPITIDTNAAETLTTLVLNADDTNLDYTDEDGTTTQLDFTDLVANLETITTLVDNTDGTFTYTNESGTPVTIDTNAAETLTTLVLNADDTNLDYSDEDGTTTQLDFTDLVANLETITTLVDNTDGTFTYTNEAGTPVTIDTNAVETLTTLVLNADDTNLDYTDEDGTTTQLDFTDLVANLETITTLVDNTDGTFTYTNEAGTPVTIDTNAAETLTTLVLNADDTNLDYTDEDGVTTQLDFTDLVANLETITTLVDNTDGTFTYTNEAGTPVTIDTNAAETLTTLVLNADDTNLDYTDEDGTTTQLDFTDLVANLETITTLVDNTDGTFTYTNEAGTPITIDTNAVETLTTLVLNADDTNLDYTDEDGVTTQLDFTDLVANLETITTLVDNTDGTFTYTNEAGTPVTIDTNAVETLTTLVLNADDTNLDYTDEDGTTTQLDFTDLVANLETITTLVDNTDGTFTYTNEAGTPVTIDTNVAETLTTLVLNADDTNLDYTDENGTTTQLDFTDLVANLETITTLVDNTDGTFTYTNEAGTPVTIDTNAVETLTTLVLNADDTNLDYTDEDGTTTQLDFTDLVANLETITTLVDNTDGTFTYTNEAGTPVTIDTNAAETLTTLVLNADDTNLDYTDEDGTTTQLDFTDLVANLETITTLVDNTDGTFTYTNEAGTPVTIDTNAVETLTTLVLNADDTNLDYTDEDGTTTQLDFTDLVANLETITTLVDNTDGTFTYTNEAGATTVISVSALETLTTLVLNADDTNLDYTDEDGVTTQLDFTDLVANLETITTLVDNTDGTFTYTNEAGTPVTIDTNAAETLTTLVLNADDTNLDYTDEDGTTTQLDFTDLVTNLETITTLVDNTDGTFTYTNEAGTPITIDTNAAETLTTLVLNADDTNLDYTDEDGVTTQLDFTDLVANLETVTTLSQDVSTGIITYTNEDSTAQTANVVSTDAGNQIEVGSDGGAYLNMPTIYAAGKMSGAGTLLSDFGVNTATTTRLNEGDYRINFTTALPNANYIIQLTILDCDGNCPPAGGSNYDDPGITYYGQDVNGFNVNIGDNDNGASPKIDIDLEFMFTVIRLP